MWDLLTAIRSRAPQQGEPLPGIRTVEHPHPWRTRASFLDRCFARLKQKNQEHTLKPPGVAQPNQGLGILSTFCCQFYFARFEWETLPRPVTLPLSDRCDGCGPKAVIRKSAASHKAAGERTMIHQRAKPGVARNNAMSFIYKCINMCCIIPVCMYVHMYVCTVCMRMYMHLPCTCPLLCWLVFTATSRASVFAVGFLWASFIQLDMCCI